MPGPEWLAVSYAVDAPIMVGDTEVVRGTNSLADVMSWPTLALRHPRGPLWDRAARLAAARRPHAFVGHSFGASIASALADMHQRPFAGYGRPGLGAALAGDVMNYDPVTMLMRGDRRPRVGHSLTSYG